MKNDYESIFNGKMRIKKGYLWTCIILGILFYILLFAIFGCAGMGLNKKATLMPDEISVSVDMNPVREFECDEVTVGGKWKLK